MCYLSVSSKVVKNEYEGTLASLPEFQITININYLKDGVYTLKITHKNKTIKTIKFEK